MRELSNLPPGCRTVVFVGPTLPVAEVRKIIPDALILPPVGFGDIYALIASEVDQIIIIDGLFHGQPPVWQREIVLALASGITVIGAASMGALRALELAPFGMIGIGQVVRWYRDGRIEGDDEVALLHADHELDYLPLSVPLVDVRSVLDDALLKAELGAELVSAIIRELKHRSHAERTPDEILTIAGHEGASEQVKLLLSARFSAGFSSLKKQDARDALELCRNPVQIANANELAAVEPVPIDGMSDRTLESTMMRAACLRDGRRARIKDLVQLAKGDVDECTRRLRDEARRWFLQDWCSMTASGPDQHDLTGFAATWLEERCSGNPATWLRENGLCGAELDVLLTGRCIEAWLEKSGPEKLGLPATSCNLSVADLVLADWALRMQISPPDDVSIDDVSMTQWLERSTPAFFGAITWVPDRALVECLQLDGDIARLADQMLRDGDEVGQ